MSPFTKIDKNLLYQSKNQDDTRLSSLLSSPEEALVHLFGFPDDEGVEINGGRTGASEGPDSIRKYLYRMTADSRKKGRPFYDGGNLSLKTPLEERHELASSEIYSSLSKGKKTLSFGGGHDYGYVDGKAFLKNCSALKTKKPLIINFDAHLDVRPPTRGISSGTPFYRLKEFDQNFDLIQVGIQPQCNSSAHLAWCEQKNIKIIFKEFSENEQMFAQKTLAQIDQMNIDSRPCFISVDIDFFDSSYAQGCSQAWPTGISPSCYFLIYESLAKRCQLHSMGIYEVAPRLDKDDQTSKLAALIAYKYLMDS